MIRDYQHLLSVTTSVFGNAKAEDLKQIAGWMAEGKIKPVIDSNYRFEELRKAYQRVKMGRAKGKIIVNFALEEYVA